MSRPLSERTKRLVADAVKLHEEWSQRVLVLVRCGDGDAERKAEQRARVAFDAAAATALFHVSAEIKVAETATSPERAA